MKTEERGWVIIRDGKFFSGFGGKWMPVEFTPNSFEAFVYPELKDALRGGASIHVQIGFEEKLTYQRIVRTSELITDEHTDTH